MTTCAFGPLTLDYDERVLTPRPWTLLQSEWAAELAADAWPGPLLELCAGAGHIGLAAAVLSGRPLVQVELDPVAAGFAADNAAAAGVADRVEIRNERLQAALRPDERFAVIVADPPYLPTSQVTRWPEDPVLAIDGGVDGLDVVADCLLVAGRHVDLDGAVLLQVAGDVQVHAVTGLLLDGPDYGLRVADVRRHDPERAVMLLRPIG